MKNFKKFILFLTFSVFLFSIFGYFVLAQETEQIYPQVPGAQQPTTTKTFLPQYIKYVFNFALIIAGIIAFLSIVYGGIRYLVSAGNPSAMGDAKSQIAAGILGLLLLFVSFLILAKLNPQLTVLKIGRVEFAKGVILYADRTGDGVVIDCEARRDDTSGLEEGKDFLRAKSSMSWLGDFSNKARSIYFYDSSDELEVKIFRQRDYQELAWNSINAAPFNRGVCFALAPPQSGSSIQLFYKTPGVYLFTDSNCKENPHLYIADNSNFTGFHDEVKSIKIVPRTETVCDVSNPACPWITNPEVCQESRCQKHVVKDKMGAVLHEHSDFKGDAEVFFGGSVDTWPPSCIPLNMTRNVGCGDDGSMSTSFCGEHVREESSAITVFLQRPPGSSTPSGQVILYEHENYNGDEPGGLCIYGTPPVGPIPPNVDEPRWEEICPALQPKKTSSIRVEGDYIAVLFREDGRGEVFRESDIRLKDNHIGNDEVKFMLVIPVIKRGL